ncbi:hypothetical protein K8I28_02465 [bacterium]|nr:hypothetical protein [bacterium]
MWYLIAAEGNDLDAPIAKRFGHAAYHLLIHKDTNEIRVFPGAHHDPETHKSGQTHGHGFGRFSTEPIAGIISGNMGPHAFDQATELGWDIYVVRGKNVGEALKSVKNGEVSPSKEASMKHSVQEGKHAGGGNGHQHQHTHGHGHGGGCCGGQH